MTTSPTTSGNKIMENMETDTKINENKIDSTRNTYHTSIKRLSKILVNRQEIFLLNENNKNTKCEGYFLWVSPLLAGTPCIVVVADTNDSKKDCASNSNISFL